ncbi:V-set and immunoglobulin domain-containing protein 10-like 2, partial [Salvelinus sp. IW2-2015]|uniref:V-set and immunoglobulin domain-containing protein 10-like 2 n=1 Tax=Salvelinus sp. IW2-2015 TaxID=2691554 RepID=UPI0038D4CB94
MLSTNYAAPWSDACYTSSSLEEKEGCRYIPVSKPNILLSDASPAEGSSVWLRCGLENGTEPLFFMWEHETYNGLVSTIYQGNRRVFNMTEVTRNQTGWYRCGARNQVNQEQSNSIWLDIIFGPDIPQIDVTPYSITDRGYSAQERQTVSLLCQAQSNPPSQYVWFYNNSQVYTGPQFTITRILRMRTGTYACQAQNTYLNTRSLKTINLTVYYPPDGSPSCSVLPAMNYSSLNLTCSWPGGLPPPSLRWTTNLLAQVHTCTRTHTRREANHVSVLQSGSQTSNNSLFTCLGIHPALNTSTQCTARAWSPYGEPVCSAYATGMNQNLLLSCSWEGGSPRAVVWWEVPKEEGRSQEVESSKILVLRSNSTQNGQAYTCYGKHPLETHIRTCSLVPVSKPYILLSDASPAEGSSVWLRCGLENGTGPLYFLWEHETYSGLVNTVSQGNSSVFNMTEVNRNHTGWYRCVARNQVNQERSDRIWLDIIYPPDGSPSCSVLPAMNYSSLNLTCSWPGGLPPPSLRWTTNLLAQVQGGAWLGGEGAWPANNVSVLQSGSQTSNNSLFTCLGMHPALNTSTQCTARA